MEVNDPDLQVEDEIIAQLETSNEPKAYCDYEFIPHPRSLYVNEHFVPAYDEGIHTEVVWERPGELFNEPQYFKTASYAPKMKSGRLDDKWLLGVFAALASHPSDLVETLFCSRPDDFRKYGIYTCRFYKEGEWSTVTTDTRIPCCKYEDTVSQKIKLLPMYGTSMVGGEVWVAFLEKAYAKFAGCYESVNDGLIADALVHLTGGVTMHFGLQANASPQRPDFEAVFDQIMNIPRRSAVMICESDRNDSTDACSPSELGIVPRRPYTVIRLMQVADVRLVLLRSPWEGSSWTGPWAEHDRAWEDYPDVARMLAEDDSLTPCWNLSDPQCICMPYSDFWREFTDLYVCRLFDENIKQYGVVGQWKGKQAGGPAQSLANRRPDSNQEEKRDDDHKRPTFSTNTTISSSRIDTTADGEPAWFLNPQYSISCRASTSLTVSLLLLGQPGGKKSSQRRPYPGFEIFKQKRADVPARVWECNEASLVSMAPNTNLVLHKMSSEVVVSGVEIESKFDYIIVPHISLRGRDSRFFA